MIPCTRSCIVLALVALAASCTGPRAASTRAHASTTTGARAMAPGGSTPAEHSDAGTQRASAGRTRRSPPSVGPERDVHLPPIARSTLPNGLEVDVVEYHTLPVLHLRLVVRDAGTASDPQNMQGLSAFVGDMLKEGTTTRSSEEIAEEIEFVGGHLAVTTGPDETTIAISVLRDHAEMALNLLGELVSAPTFPQVEIDRLRRREIDRLTQEQNDPGWLSRRAFLREVYGPHPYARFDTTPEVLRRLTRADLVAFHRAHYRAGSMYLVAVGDVRPSDFHALVARSLGRVPRGAAPVAHFPPLPSRAGRQIVIVDRHASAQSLLRVGNAAVRRADEDYVPLTVTNQVLGAGPSSRLFVDLRERRSLTYGIGSRLSTSVDVGTFQVAGSVRTEVTAQALEGILEHIARIGREPASSAEFDEARQYLRASFPLSIDTPSDLANLVSELRLYGLPDTYWDTYRSRIGQVTREQALEAARRHILPDTAVIVIVGNASAFENAVRRWGPVRVVDTTGRTLRELPPQQ